MSRQTFLLTILGCFFPKLKPKPEIPPFIQGYLDGIKYYTYYFKPLILDGPSGIGGIYRFKTNKWQS